MYKLIGFFLTLLFSVNILAQPSSEAIERIKKTEQKIDTLKEYISKAVESRNFNELLAFTNEGISYGRDNSAKAYFAYYRGYAFHELKQFDSAISNTLMAFELYQKDGDLSGEADAMLRLHYIYYYAGRGKEREPMMKRAISIIDTTNNVKAKAVLIGMLGEYYYDQGLYEKSIDYKLKYINLEKNKKFPLPDNASNNIAVTYAQIGETFFMLNESTKALEYLRESKNYYRNYYRGEATVINDFITAFVNLNQSDSAIACYNNLYRMMKPNDTLFEILAGANNSLAKYYLERNNLIQAFLFAKKQFYLSKKSNELLEIISSHLLLGEVLCKQQNYKEALEHLTIAEKNIYSFGRDNVAALRLIQAKVYAGLDKWEEAYLKYDEYNQLHDSIIAEYSTKNIANAEAKFQTKEKQQQIEVQQAQLTYNKKQKIGFLAGLLLMGAIVTLLIIFYRNKKRTANVLNSQNQQLSVLNSALAEANQTKAKLFGIISHDLRSPISQVYQFLRLQQMDHVNLSSEQQVRLNEKIESAAGSLLETMENLLLWSKTQLNQFEPRIQNIQLYDLMVECLNLLQLNIESKKLIIINKIPLMQLVESDANILQTIIRNLLQNAINASPENENITVLFKSNTLYINSNGNPFTQTDYERIINSDTNDQLLSGFGLKTVAELSYRINATILFSSDDNFSTSSQVKLS